MWGREDHIRDRRLGQVLVVMLWVVALGVVVTALPSLGLVSVEAPTDSSTDTPGSQSGMGGTGSGGIGTGGQSGGGNASTASTDTVGSSGASGGASDGADQSDATESGTNRSTDSAETPAGTDSAGRSNTMDNGTNRDGNTPSEEATETGTTGGTQGASVPREKPVGTSELSNPSEQPALTVTSPEPMYWRLDAYDRYTGSGWQRTGDTSAYPGELRPTGPVSKRVTYQITLNRSLSTLPVAWQVAHVDGVPDDALRVSDTTGIHTASVRPAGTQYTAESYRHTASPTALKQVASVYPATIEARYTTLPASTPERVTDRAERITRDADSAFEATAAVTRHLQRTKDYSLDAAVSDSRQPVDEFLFEMEAGYCEHFASSAAVLLRTQGIPARYVAGYTGGERIGTTDDGDSRYLVKDIHAHAWVEVYFPGHGWQIVDPTPSGEGNPQSASPTGVAIGASSLTGETQRGGEPSGVGDSPTTENRGASDQRGGRSTATDDTGEPSDDRTDGADDGSTTQEGEQSTGTTSPDRYDVTLNTTTPVPGSGLEVTVTKGGDEAAGVPVRFNGEVVGKTDASGTVVGPVPYTKRLEIAIGADATTPLAGTQSTPDVSYLSRPPTSATQAATRLPATASDEPVRLARTASREITVASDVTVDLERTPLIIGARTEVRTTIRGVPISGAAISIDGQRIGETDSDGTVTFTVPEGTNESAEITVRRGEISSERTVRTGALTLDVSPSTPIALPLTQITVNTTVAGAPVAGAEISLKGTNVGETGPDGTLALALPVAPSIGLTSTYQGATTSHGIPLLRNLLIVTVLGGALIGVSVREGRRRGLLTADLFFAPVRLLHRGLGTLIAGARWLAGRIARLRSLLTRDRRSILAHLRHISGRIVQQWRKWRPKSIRAALWVLVERIAASVRRARQSVEQRDAPTIGQPTRQSSETSPGPEDDNGQTQRSVRELWQAFVRLVLRRVNRTITPGAIARRAIDQGLPEAPVTRLTDAFRAVEYGQASADDKRDRAEAAYLRIEAAVKEDTTAASNERTTEDNDE